MNPFNFLYTKKDRMNRNHTNTLIVIGLIALFLLCAGAFVKVRFFEDGSYWSSNTKQMRSDKVGRIEATGEDLRSYEFTPQAAPHMQCVFVSGDKKGSLACFPKTAQVK
jgi:hypothetical protein